MGPVYRVFAMVFNVFSLELSDGHITRQRQIAGEVWQHRYFGRRYGTNNFNVAAFTDNPGLLRIGFFTLNFAFYLTE
ncbi:Uncharacterised protein [Enterobacter hormaechei]|nr:Uncharacterised protein [Enterobacter hormaechei]